MNYVIILFRTNTMRNSISEITAQLERDFYYLQCTENYQLDSRKMILDNNTLIILGSLDNDLFRKKVQVNSSRSKQ